MASERIHLRQLEAIVEDRGLEQTIDLVSLMCIARGEQLSITGDLQAARHWTTAGQALQRCAATPAVHEVSPSYERRSRPR